MDDAVTVRDKLFTGSFLCACSANFLLYFGFYLLMPVLPMFLMESFSVNEAVVGTVLSCYVISTLIIRPFSAFFADMFDRKRMYILFYSLFVMIFVSYTIVQTVAAFVVMRIMHGFVFGNVSTSGNTLVVDIMPSSRRGEGLGYFGMANNLAMATGPMVGLFIHDSIASFDVIFYSAVLSGCLGLISASFIKRRRREPVLHSEPISFDRFFLRNGLFNGFCLFFLGLPYGMTSTYVALYARELGITTGTGLFFTFMAAGLIVSRLFAGRLVDRGYLTRVISVGSGMVAVVYMVFANIGNIGFAVNVWFFAVALLLGVGYGMMFPAYNTLFVNLAPKNRRATASSTYLTSWDVGLGVGLISGGIISDQYGRSYAYMVGALSAAVSFLLFVRWGANYYERHKLEV